MIAAECDVVVVGAGPCGLSTALGLVASGHEVVVVDGAQQGANTSRAAVVHARTLEVLDGLDVSRRLLAEGVIVPTFTVRDRNATLATIDFRHLPSAYPFTLMIPQNRTEAILGERLSELGGEVRWGHAVTNVADEGPRVRVDLSGPNGTQTIRASYLVGADGMHSTVRQSTTIDFVGAPYRQSFILADVRMQWALPKNEVQLFFASAGLVVVAPLPGGRHRIVATADTAPEHPTSADVQSLLDERGPSGSRVEETLWASRFRVHHRVASRYVDGRIVLAGDAAHVHSPAGGQGMNTGIQDAVDLAATITEALTSGADPAGLKSYEQRRRPVALNVVAMTDRATRVATVHGRTARTARNAVIRTVSHIPGMTDRLAAKLGELPPDRPRRLADTPKLVQD